jgi:hypothetical protein
MHTMQADGHRPLPTAAHAEGAERWRWLVYDTGGPLHVNSPRDRESLRAMHSHLATGGEQ